MNKKMLKKVLIICALIIIVLISFGTVNKSNAAEVVETWDVSADDGESHVTATLYDDGKLVLDGTGKMQDYTYNNHKQIPYNSKKADIKEIEIKNGVTSIGSYAFKECSNLTENLVIPDSITSIGEAAFYGCSGLMGDLIIPEGVTSIGEDSFKKCGFTGKLELPSTLKEIVSGAFYGCSGFTGELDLPSTLTEIGDYAFYKCRGLTGNLVIGDSVTYIGESAFEGCSGFTGKLELPSTLKEIVSCTFYGCSGFTGDLIIPEGVTSIGGFAFQECGFTGKLELPSTLTEIKGYAFYNNYFTGNLIIPEGVTSIGYRAFEYCSGFTGKLELPSTLINIESEAFDGCSGFTGELIIPEGVTSIDSMAFDGCCSIITVQCTGEDVQEIELPEIIKRTKTEGDILYTDQTFYCQNCKLSEDGNKLEVYKANDYQTLIRVGGGALEGFEIVIVPSGTILYNVEWWTNRNVIATLHIGEGETVTNNEGNNQHIFTENGEFIFKYLDVNNNERQAIAKVDNIVEFSLEQYEETTFDNNNYIEKILPNTTVNSFIKKIKTNGTIKILKNDQEVTNENDLICTGMTMKVSWGYNKEMVYTTIVTGDLTGNGKMGIGDLSKLSRYAAGMDETLSGAYLRASDVVKDGKYGRISDISKMSRVLAGMDNF